MNYMQQVDAWLDERLYKLDSLKIADVKRAIKDKILDCTFLIRRPI